MKRSAIESLGGQMFVALVAGLVAALVIGGGNNIGSGPFWASLAGSGAVAFLLIYFLVQTLFEPVRGPKFTTNQSNALSTSIRTASTACYAISSNWLDLWNTSAFRSYLHLDATLSLINFTRSRLQPIHALSSDDRHQKDFCDFALAVVSSIAKGEEPIGPHRVRLLIYERSAYSTNAEDIMSLVRDHATGRIPCLPLVLEDAVIHMTENEKRDVATLVAELQQTVIDKVPGASRWDGWRSKRRAKRSVRFVAPDILIVDPQIAQKSQAWWYNKSGVQHWTQEHANEIALAHRVFRSFCRVAESALWNGYSPNVIGPLPITQHDSLPSEAFFSLDHYETWLHWIRQHRKTNSAAAQLDRWDSNERNALAEAVGDVSRKAGEAHVNVLDLGCGFGRHAKELLTSFPNVYVEGIDINARMVTEADTLLYKAGLAQRCRFHVRDASDLGIFGKGSFQVAICTTNTLGNMPDDKRARMLSEARRVLCSGGLLVVSVYSRSSVAARKESYQLIGLSVAERGAKIVAAEGLESDYFTEDQLVSLLEASAGFRLRTGVKELNGIGLFVVAENP